MYERSIRLSGNGQLSVRVPKSASLGCLCMREKTHCCAFPSITGSPSLINKATTFGISPLLLRSSCDERACLYASWRVLTSKPDLDMPSHRHYHKQGMYRKAVEGGRQVKRHQHHLRGCCGAVNVACTQRPGHSGSAHTCGPLRGIDDQASCFQHHVSSARVIGLRDMPGL